MKPSRSKKNILFYIPKPFLGGEAIAFNNLAAALERTGKYFVKAVIAHECDIDKVVVDSKYLIGGLYKKGIQNILLSRIINFINLLTNYFFYTYFARKFKHDLFVVFSAPDFSYMIKYSSHPTFGWFHFMPLPIRKRWPDQLRLINAKRNLSQYKALIAITDEVRTAWTQLYEGKLSIGFVIQNQFDIDMIRAKAKEKQSTIPLSTTPNIIYVGRLSEEKGVDRLLRVARRCHDEGCLFNLWLVGDGPQMELCKKIASGDDSIHLLGAKSNSIPYIMASDALILPSRKEALGLVLWEALINGVPVVATKAGGTVSALDKGRYGLLVENNEAGLEVGLKAATLGLPPVRKQEFVQYIKLQNKKGIVRISEMLA